MLHPDGRCRFQLPPGADSQAGAEMTRDWSAATFSAIARELRQRLRDWHLKYPSNPTHFVSLLEARRTVRRTFRQMLQDIELGPKPGEGMQLSIDDEGDPAEDVVIGATLNSADERLDRLLTLIMLADFQLHLEATETFAALNDLRERFGQLLDLPAWTVREPQDVWEHSMAHFDRDEKGELRWYIVTGREVPTVHLDNIVVAADKLLAAAPAGWSATARSGQRESQLTTAPTAETPTHHGGDNAAVSDHDQSELLVWLRRVTLEWPPMGIDWPLVLSAAEGLFLGTADRRSEESESWPDGQSAAAYIRKGFESEEIRSVDPFSRGHAFGTVLLDAFWVLDALCAASLMMGYDLDAIERPVKRLAPFHGLMCLGQPVVELIRALRDVVQADVDAVSEQAPEPVKVGAAFGRNTLQAIWNLADEICQLNDSVSEGRLSQGRFRGEPPGTMEFAWWNFSNAVASRLPDSLEVKKCRVQLAREAVTAFARVHPESGDPSGTGSNAVRAQADGEANRGAPQGGDGAREVLLDAGETAPVPNNARPSGRGQADNKPDNRGKKSHCVPENPQVLRLAKKIKKERQAGVSQIDSARDFCEGDETKAESLLRQLRRYPHLLD
jgi:hypothetical protein